MNAPVNPGDQLDRYQIEDLIYRGGAASTFRAIDLRTNQPVAIKIPDPEMESDPIFSDRFHREEEIGKTLDDPGILKVLPTSERSRLYIVTEWFNGQSLRDLLANQAPISPERAIRIAVNIGNALAYIHGHGIVHRNLKPENILVDAEDGIKLINFDTAAKAGSRRITFANLAQVVGMSKYISPEELNGKRGDARTDIYATGAILYEMVTGRQPFQETDSFNRTLGNLVPPRKIASAISPQLQEVICRTLEPAPKDRYSSAREFVLSLNNLDNVIVIDRTGKKHVGLTNPLPLKLKKIAFFSGIALIPLLILAFLLWFAHR